MKKNAPTVKYEVTPKVLETHAGEVNVAVKGTFPDRFFNRAAILEISPVIKYEGGELALKPITLQGENVKANHTVINLAGGTFNYTDKFTFNEAMRVSELYVRVKATRGNRSVQFDPVKLADGIIATSTLTVNKPKPVMVGDRFQRVIPKTQEAQILYQINRAEVRPAELRKAEIVDLRNFIVEAAKDERIVLKEAGINAFASPDGPIDFNEKLAINRKGSANAVLAREMRRANVAEATVPNFFNTHALGEDWDGFKKLMEASDIKDRELILRVLSMYSDPVVREREIRNIAAAFTEIAETILPQLRRSVLTINFEKIGYSDEEILSIWNTEPGKLNLEELLYGATLAKDKEQKLAMYLKAAELYPNCFRARNNVGYVYLKMNKPAEAKKAFETAQKICDNDVVKNNLGAVALLEGNIVKAEELFTSVSKASDETNFNLGIINLMKGDYVKASNFFGNACHVNSGLARLLNNKVDDAYRLLSCIEEPGAMAYYLKAIVGARKQDNTILFDNLRSAVGKDATLKAYAKKDMEFAKYFQDATFQSIVQ